MNNPVIIASFSGEYRFLSNFYPAEVWEFGMKFPTAEHAFQAAKTLDESERRKIQKAETPGQAKRLGRTVELRPDWEQIKLDVMRAILLDKFTRNPELADWLMATDPAKLVEGNTWGDTYWGVCEGKGHNMLGELLMAVRSELIAEYA